MTVMLGEARGMVTLDISDLSAKVGMATTQLNALNGAGAKGMGGFQQELARTGVSVDQLGYGLIGLGGALLAPMAIGLKSAVDLEQAFKDVEASLPKDERGRMGELESMIVKIGASGQYSAGEIAMVTEELAKSGYTIDQILSGDPAEGFGNMAQAVSDLSSATGSGLEPAVSGIAAAMAIWNPKIVDSSIALTDASRAADIFTVAANSSQSDVQDIIAGMRNFGPAAAMVGIGFEDAAGAVALFTNFGLKATDAGTSLTRAITMLSDPTSEAAGWMEQLSIAPFKDGKFIGLPALMDQLAAGMKDMDDKTKLAALSSIFGAEAMDVMGLSILTAGDGLREITGQMSEWGIASEQAKLRTQTLRGALERLAEGFTTMLAVVASGLIQPLTLLANGLDLVTSAVMKIPQPILATIGVLITMAGATATAAGAILLATPRIQAFVSTLRAMSGMPNALGAMSRALLGMGGAAGFLARALRLLILPLGLVFGGAILAYQSNFLGFADVVNEKVGQIKSAWTFLTGLFDAPVSNKAKQEFDDFAGSIQSVVGSGADGLDWFVLGPDGEKLGQIIESAKDDDGVITMQVRDPDGNMRTLQQNADGTTQWVVDVEVKETEAMGRIERINKGLEGVKNVLDRKGLGIFNPLITGAQKSLVGIGKLGGGFNRLTDWWGRFKSDFAGTRGIPGMDFMDRIRSAWRTSGMFDNPLKDWSKAIRKNAGEAWNGLLAGVGKIPKIGTALQSGMRSIGSAVGGFFSKVTGKVGDVVGSFRFLRQMGYSPLEAATEALGYHFPLLGKGFDLVGKAVGGVRGVFTGIASTISGKVNKALDTGKTFVDEFAFAWDIANKHAGPFQGTMSTTERAAFALGEAFKAVGLEGFGQGIQDLSARLHKAWGEDGVAGLLREIPVVGGAAASTFETLQGWGETAARGVSWAWTELQNDFESFKAEGMNPLQAGFMAVGELALDVLGKIGNALLDLGADLGGWALNVGIPTLSGWITDFLDDPWGAIKDAWGGLAEFRASLNDWYIDVAEPDVQSAIVNFDNWLSEKLGIDPPLRTKIGNWIVTVAQPALQKGGWEIVTLITDLIGAFVVTIGSNIWSVMMGKPTMVLGFDINEAFEDAVGNTILWTADVLATLAIKIENDPMKALKVTLLAAGAIMLAGLVITGGVGALITLGVVLGLAAFAVAVYNAVKNFFTEDDGARLDELQVKIGRIWAVLEGIPILGKVFWAIRMVYTGVATLVGWLLDLRNGLLDLGGPAEGAVRVFEKMFLAVAGVLAIMKVGGWKKAAGEVTPLIQSMINAGVLSPAKTVGGVQAFIHGLQRIASFPFRLIFKPLDTLRDLFGVTGRAAQTGSQSLSMFSKRTGVNFRLIGNIFKTFGRTIKLIGGSLLDPILYPFRAGLRKWVVPALTSYRDQVIAAFKSPLKAVFGFTEALDKTGKVLDTALGRRMPKLTSLDNAIRHTDGLLDALRKGAPKVIPGLIDGFRNFSAALVSFNTQARGAAATIGRTFKSIFTGAWLKSPFLDDSFDLVSPMARQFGRFDDVLRGAVLPMQRYLDDGTRMFGPFFDELRPMGPMLDDLAPRVGRLRSAFTSMGTGLLNVVKGAGGGIRGFFSSFGDELAKGVKNAGGLRQLAGFIRNLGPVGRVAAAGIALLTGTALFKGGVLDGVIGGVKSFGSAVSGAFHALSNAYQSGGIAAVLNLIITEAGQFFSSLPDKLAGFIRNANWGAIATTLLTVLSMVMMGPWGLALGLLAPVVGPMIGDAIGGLVSIFDGFVTDGFEGGLDNLEDVITKGTRNVGKTIGKLGQTLVKLADPIERIPIIGKPIAGMMRSLGTSMMNFGTTIGRAAPLVGQFAKNLVRDLAEGATRVWSVISGRMGPAFTNLMSTIGNLLGPIKEIGAGFLDLIRGDFIDGLKGIGSGFVDLLGGMLDMNAAWSDFISAGLSGAADLATAIFSKLGDQFPGFADTFKSVGDVFSNVFDGMSELAGGVADLLRGDFSGAWDHLKDAGSAAWDAIVAGAQVIPNLLRDVFNAIPWSSFFDALKDAGSWILEKLGEAGDLAADVGQWIYEKFQAVDWPTWVKLALSTLANIGSWILEKIKQAAAWASDVGGWLAEQLGKVPWATYAKIALSALANFGSWVVEKIKQTPAFAADIAGFVWDALKDVNWADQFKDAMGALASFGTWLIDLIRPHMAGFLSWLIEQVNAIIRIIQSAIAAFNKLPGPDITWSPGLVSNPFVKAQGGAETLNNELTRIHGNQQAYLDNLAAQQTAATENDRIQQTSMEHVQQTLDYEAFREVVAARTRGYLREQAEQQANITKEIQKQETLNPIPMERQRGATDAVLESWRKMNEFFKANQATPTSLPPAEEPKPIFNPYEQGVPIGGFRDMTSILRALNPQVDTYNDAVAQAAMQQRYAALAAAMQSQQYGQIAPQLALVNTGFLGVGGSAKVLSTQLQALTPAQRALLENNAAVNTSLSATPFNNYNTGWGKVTGAIAPVRVGLTGAQADFLATHGAVDTSTTGMNTSVVSNFGAMLGSTVTNFGAMRGTASTESTTMQGNVTGAGSSMSAALVGTIGGMRGSVLDRFTAMQRGGTTEAGSLNRNVTSEGKGMDRNMSSSARLMGNNVVAAARMMQSGASGEAGRMASIGTSRAAEMAAGMGRGANQARGNVQGAIGQIPGIISGIGGSAAGVAYGVGVNISTSMASGMRSALGAIQAAANAMVAAAETALRARAMIASPSKLFTMLGLLTGRGYPVGMLQALPEIRKAAQQMVDAPRKIMDRKLGRRVGVRTTRGTGATTVINDNRQTFALSEEALQRVLAQAEKGAQHAESWGQPQALSQYVRR